MITNNPSEMSAVALDAGAVAEEIDEEKVYVVRLSFDDLQIAKTCAVTSHGSRTLIASLQSARPEHPEQGAALEQLAAACKHVQGKITWDDPESKAIFMDALEAVCRTSPAAAIELQTWNHISNYRKDGGKPELS